MSVPPIPARLANRPTVGGLVIPWLNVRLADGGVDFRRQHYRRLVLAVTRGLCQVCGQTLTSPMVLLGDPARVDDGFFDEPPMHPECAAYVMKACPMVAGRMARFASGPSVSETHRGARCSLKGCECAGWVPHPGEAAEKDGKPAHPWVAVWVNDYSVAVTSAGVVRGVMLTGPPLKVRTVSSPPADGQTDASSNEGAPQ